MKSEPIITTEEVKIKMATRFPPGDKWKPVSNPSTVLESLTDCLEYIYQNNSITKFYIDAREGSIYSVDIEERVTEPEPDKKWSLYGED
jgi:hypothetical protein